MLYPTLQAQKSATFTRPPLDGSLFLPDVFEYHAEHSPEHPLFVYADGDGVKHTITWARAAKAFIAGAHIVRQAIGLSDPHERPVVAVLAVSDQSNYLSVLASVMRAGAVPFPISTRNSAAAIAHLLKSMGCAHIIVSADAAMQTLASGAAAQMADALSMHPMPTFQQLYQEGGSASLKPLPPIGGIGGINKEAHAIIMHSSGSTAFPKAVPLTQHMMVESGLIPYYSETDFCEQVMSVHAVPMFHMMGFVNFPYCAYSGLTLAVFSPTVPSGVPNPDKVLEAALACESTLMLSAPTFLEAWAREPKQVEALSKLRTAIFGGGPLHPAAGEILVKNGVHIAHLYGLTEASCASVFIPESNPPEGWDYFFFSPHTDVEFVPSEDYPDVYRVLLKKCATHTPAVLNAVVNGVPAFDTKDLLLQNAKNPRLWKMFGRHDDQIVHSNGEKTNPAPIEAILVKDRIIKHAIMFGRGEFHAGVIVMPADEDAVDPGDMKKVADLRRRIWPTVEQANRLSPTHSRIFKEMILIGNQSKPFEMTAKATPRRQAVLDAYAEEIRGIYAAVAESSLMHILPPETFDTVSTLSFVRTVVGEVMAQLPGDDQDIFQHGCDSLQATWIRNSILRVLIASKKIDAKAIPSNFVYAHPTVRLLADMLEHLASGGASSRLEVAAKRSEDMMRMVTKYTSSPAFPNHVPAQSEPQPEGVLVTGTTGVLGSHILAELLGQPGSGNIYALNRSSGALGIHARQRAVFEREGLNVSLLDSPRLRLLEGDLLRQEFGLQTTEFNMLLRDVTCVVHNAWQVNFSVSLASLEPHIAATRALVDFALSSQCSRPPKFLFVSSVGVFRSTNAAPVALEQQITDPNTALGLGYTESKWVAEQILEAAASQTTLKPVIIRVGQLCGASNGAWKATEWFPTLLRTSQLLGALPILHGKASWVRVSDAARIIVNMSNSAERYLHLTHPHPVPTLSVLNHISQLLSLPLIPFAEWLRALEVAASEEANAATNPGVRLLEFYRTYANTEDQLERETLSPVVIDNAKAARISGSVMNELTPLSNEDAEKWVVHLQQNDYLV